MLINRLSQTGDTIVEVLIVLTILGLSISLSYATANHSLMATRQAQESAEATNILQSQIEEMKSLAPGGNIFVTTSPPTFCINTSVNPGVVVPIPSAPPFPAACQQGIYKIVVTYDASNSDAFKAVATWDDVSGEGTDTSTLFTRIHKVN